MIAEALLAHLPDLTDSVFAKVEIAGPGFINLFLSPAYWAGVVLGACANKEYGRTDHGKGAKYNVEFVSANPTGPMHMGNARGGALGDCLAAVLDWSGYDVTREFYINDAGNQIQKFGKSLAVRYLQQFCGEEAYPLAQGVLSGRRHQGAGRGVRRDQRRPVRCRLPGYGRRDPVCQRCFRTAEGRPWWPTPCPRTLPL